MKNSIFDQHGFSFVPLLLFCLLFFLSSCEKKDTKSNYNLSMEERKELGCFFQEVLLDHYGAYTLFGDKPMTIEALMYYDEEEQHQLQEYFSNHPEITPIYSERHLEETWPRWKKLESNFPIRDFILAEIKLPNRYDHVSFLAFINIKNTAVTLQKYYEDFKRVYGKDFHPLEVIYQIKRGETEFWEKVLSHQALLGILLGYGYKNSWLFEWGVNAKSPCLQNLHAHSSSSSRGDPRVKAEFYIDKKPFRLPSFVCMDPRESERLMKRYRTNQKQILEIYRNKNFLEVTLEGLTR